MTLRIIANLSCAVALAASLGACGTPGNSKAVVGLLTKITTDTACSHDDDLTLTGFMITGHAGRKCPGPQVGALSPEAQAAVSAAVAKAVADYAATHPVTAPTGP